MKSLERQSRERFAASATAVRDRLRWARELWGKPPERIRWVPLSVTSPHCDPFGYSRMLDEQARRFWERSAPSIIEVLYLPFSASEPSDCHRWCRWDCNVRRWEPYEGTTLPEGVCLATPAGISMAWGRGKKLATSNLRDCFTIVLRERGKEQATLLTHLWPGVLLREEREFSHYERVWTLLGVSREEAYQMASLVCAQWMRLTESVLQQWGGAAVEGVIVMGGITPLTLSAVAAVRASLRRCAAILADKGVRVSGVVAPSLPLRSVPFTACVVEEGGEVTVLRPREDACWGEDAVLTLEGALHALDLASENAARGA